MRLLLSVEISKFEEAGVLKDKHEKDNRCEAVILKAARKAISGLFFSVGGR